MQAERGARFIPATAAMVAALTRLTGDAAEQPLLHRLHGTRVCAALGNALRRRRKRVRLT